MPVVWGLADILAPALAARQARFVVAVGRAGPAQRVSSLRHFTFRRSRGQPPRG